MTRPKTIPRMATNSPPISNVGPLMPFKNVSLAEIRNNQIDFAAVVLRLLASGRSINRGRRRE